MNDSEPQEGIFSDLEELSHKEVKLLSNKIEREIRTIEDEHKSLRNERKNQVEIVSHYVKQSEKMRLLVMKEGGF